ncbi:MAG: sugar phosphorylase [bacterium]
MNDSESDKPDVAFADLRGNSSSVNPVDPPASASEYYLLEHLSHLYGGGVAPELTKVLLQIATKHPMASRDTSASRTLTAAPALTERDVLLITYADTLVDEETPPLQVLHQFAHQQLADFFSGIHILPFFPFSSDDGFAVVDYSSVRADLGDWQDIAVLAEQFDLMFDLVINHCSREHLWFADFINGRAPGCDFFIELPADTELDAVIRPRNTPLLSEVQTYAGPKHVWTTFSDDQVDLNFGNPEVLCRFVEILFDYIHRGARYIRLDAIAFLWKRLGTNCMSLPETHMVVKVMRLLIDHTGADVILLTETNVPHMENVSYFGHRDEAHMVYQFSLAPLLLYSYLFNDGRYLQSWASDLQQPPEGCAYLNFIASHDGIGLRPLEGLLPAHDIEALISNVHKQGGFVSMRTASGGEQKAYELNISLFAAFGGRADVIPAFIGAHQLLLAFQGVPALYLRALLASQNDLAAVERTGRTRSINRGKLKIGTVHKDLSDKNSLPHKVFTALTHALRIRRQQPAFSPAANQEIIPSGPQLLVLRRNATQQNILVIASFSEHSQSFSITSFIDADLLNTTQVMDLLTQASYPVTHDISVAPYQVLWLELTGP